jgi:dipeptidyl aminopeptidase/acylaminoacyl peptidase
MRFFAIFVLACFCGASMAPVSAAPMALDDVFSLEIAADPQASPDGDTVVFVRRWMDRDNDRVAASLWSIELSSGALSPLTDRDGSASSPRFSPKGERLAYLSEGEVRMLWLESGRDARISQLEERPSGLSWSPDGKWLAFTQFVEEKNAAPVKLPGKPKGAQWAPAVSFIDQPIYRADGRGYLRSGHQQVFILPAEGGTPIQLTEGPYDHRDVVWHPEGSAVYFTANRSEQAYREPLLADIYRLELSSRQLSKVNDSPGVHGQVDISPDGKWLSWLGFEDRNLSHQANRLHLMPLAGGEVQRFGDDLDRHLLSYQWLPDSQGVVLAYDHHGKRHLARQGLDGARRVWVDDMGGTSFTRPYASGDFSITPSGGVVYTQAHPQRPAEIAHYEGADSRSLTRINADFLMAHDLGEVEELWLSSSVDERQIQAWLVYPPDFDPEQSYPLVMEIHGGPFLAYGPSFAAEVQLMAAAGYVVLYVNPRGSTSYGEDFANLIHHNYPGNDYDDLMDAVDAVIAKGFIDEDALFVTGGSGGGILTAWIVTQTQRFAAAVSAKPIINWYSFVLNADFYFFFSQYWFPGPPWEHADHYMQRSPISYVDQVTTPTMLLTGENDYRTPIAESEQFYQALHLRGVDTAMVRVPEASHSIAARPSHLMAKVAYILEWFGRYKPES